jgi:hypothetical protein
MSGFLRGRKRRFILPSEKIKDKRYDNTYKDASTQREIKGKALTLNINVSRQMAQPRELSGEGNNDSHDNQNEAQINQSLCQVTHELDP